MKSKTNTEFHKWDYYQAIQVRKALREEYSILLYLELNGIELLEGDMINSIYIISVDPH